MTRMHILDAAAAAAAIGLPGFDALLLDVAVPDLDLGRLREALVPAEPGAPDSLEAAERRHIALALRHTGGNKRQAAHLLGISRSTLLHKVRKYGLAAATLLGLSVGAVARAGAPSGEVGFVLDEHIGAQVDVTFVPTRCSPGGA